MTSRPSPTEFLRNLGSSVSQLVDPGEREDLVKTAAKAAAAGVAAEIESLKPELHGELIARAAQKATEAAVRGALQELATSFPELRDTLHQAREALQQYVEEHKLAMERGEQGSRLQTMTEGAVRGAVDELRRLTPEIVADVKRLVATEGGEVEAGLELAVEVIGRKLVAGITAELREQASHLDVKAMLHEGGKAAVEGVVDGVRATGRRAREAAVRSPWRAALAGVGALGLLVLFVRR